MRKIVYLAVLFVLLLGTVPALAQTPNQPVDLTQVLPPPVTAPARGAPVSFGGGRTLAVLDDFNRADGPIGPNWTVTDGACNVVGNAATCGNLGRATFNNAPGDGNMAEIDLACVSTVLDYQGLLLNYGGGATNLFLKVQNQSGDLMFHNAGCYTGNNGGGFGLGFFTLDSPFTTAHMKATRVGNDVTIEFTNIDGGAQPPQTYVCSGAPAPEGTGIGILGYSGLDLMDNFGGPAGACDPPTGVNFTWDPASPFVGDLVTFTGTAAGTEPLTYDWNFGDTFTAQGNPVTHAYGAAGDYLVTLTVSNGCGTASAQHIITVASPPIPAHINKMKMNGAAAARPGYYKVVASARIHDEADALLVGATVLGDMTLPNGTVYNMTYVTDAMGRAKFPVKEQLTGTYSFCVTDIQLAGYVYTPADNEMGPCMDVTVP
jgi:PKD repeat protein